MSEAALYSRREEGANVASHGLGTLAALPALVLLVRKALMSGRVLAVLGYALFGLSLLALLGASTAYHAERDPERRRRKRVLDHAAIYVLIAGTYSAFTLTALTGALRWAIFGTVWGLAVAGIVLALFFTGRFKGLMVAGYILMGWVIVLAFGPLSRSMDHRALVLLVAGGVIYTLGAILYAFKGLPWGHAIWHCFVLGGATCHVLAALAALG